jgi:hypothetical protein
MPAWLRSASVTIVITCAGLVPAGRSGEIFYYLNHISMRFLHKISFMSATTPSSRRGRPRKFSRPSRAVTLTLPDDVIAALRSVDSDLSRAVVRVVAPLLGAGPSAATELVRYGNRAVIVVPWNRALFERAGVELVPFADGRALIAFDDVLSVAQLELRLGDALADSGLTGTDRTVFEELAAILRTARRAGGASVEQRSIIVLRSEPGRPEPVEPRLASA